MNPFLSTSGVRKEGVGERGRRQIWARYFEKASERKIGEGRARRGEEFARAPLRCRSWS